jgi:AraC-like DNA-binding protein
MIDVLSQERPGMDLILGALAVEVIAEILSVMKRGQEGGRPVATVIREAKNLLAQGHVNPKHMQDFAERLNMSYSAFRRLFKAETGYSPRQFVLETKMNWAREMLVTSHATVNRIAEEAGFESVFYFMRLFKRRHGQTPSEYRESVQESQPNLLVAPAEPKPRHPNPSHEPGADLLRVFRRNGRQLTSGHTRPAALPAWS